ncbi:putative Reverse transcriptase (RNA-dependent DNA polymerase) [Monocercomonoides exilis]|uniref:putative Reverse transcriptase (RNA-dependent DNA polymerase) n=1 Tax=Monocercomonoides exilis TaxID=2049356 RepID=UPI0035594C3D|nr:putative Reverse transcriptase (RNA-dependent DNA polymerase) [Monocercomonoides exilis]|eukprot:MONOS_10871.1-p1 / transcript=MONOS_10871.1 / gene=MONOS_10871 / organism=Monocercomonoides_exilis_PA203 / gene_product=reverse transcriptase / transcript_product=reverse transcriptase / location=Mono_scaffold00513:29576-32802(+) / protein_length=868 / sequence_SO=supercontig / SO=protein_coding / is_pseudo=false
MSSKKAIFDTLEGEEITQTQHGHKKQEVKKNIVIGPPKEPLPGRLVNRLNEWKKIGEDKLVSRSIKARWKSSQSPISLEERKHRQEFRGTTEMMNNYLSLLEEELKEGVMKPIQESEVKWFNPTFMVIKINGKRRKIPDCRALNEEVQGKHFKMDSQETVVELLEENDWMTTLDISSAYQHVKVDEQLSPFLCFSFQNQYFYYVGMHFGVKDASRVFTKIMRRVASYIRGQWKVKLVIYIDDILLMHIDRDALRLISQEIAQFLRNLGWILSEEKLNQEPTGSVEFLGWLWNSEKMKVTLHERKRVLLLEDVRTWIAHAHKWRRQKTRDLAALLGKLNFVRLQHLPASLWMKRMQYALRRAIARGGWNGTVIANPMMLGEFTHWRKTLRENRSRCLRKRTSPAELATDASELECVSDKREGVQSSVEDTREKVSVAATAEDRSYSSEDRQHVHEMDDSEEEGSAIAHSNTESIGEEIEQPEHDNADRTPPGRAEHGGRRTQPDGEKAGLCTEGGESRRDIANSRTENTRYNFRTDCTGSLREYLETILREKEERERNTRRRHSASPPVPEKHWTSDEREDERSSEGSDDSDSASLAWVDLDYAAAAWAFDKDPGYLSGVITHIGEENTQGRDLFLVWGEYVGAKDIAAAILRNLKSERETLRTLLRLKQILDEESFDDTDPFTTKENKWIIADFFETLSNTNLSSGVIHQTSAELERMRRKTSSFKDNATQTQVQTKTNGGKIIIVNINKHPNPRIDAVVVLQRWMDYTRTTFKDGHVWFDVIENQPANLQRKKEELVIELRENVISDAYTTYSIKHAVKTHSAEQEYADWNAINAYARCAPGSRVAQEYYTVLQVQDTKCFPETIGS